MRDAAGQLNTESITVSSDLGGLEIYADPMISRVFYNLIDNAIRHGGHVTRIAFSCHPEGDSMIVVCEDDGVGIAPGDKDQIFAKGFGRDSGLGLFLIHEILAITGITIRETGIPGRGARFEMTVGHGKFRTALPVP